jgi:hypothetical protein
MSQYESSVTSLHRFFAGEPLKQTRRKLARGHLKPLRIVNL